MGDPGAPAIPQPGMDREKAMKKWADAHGLKRAKPGCFHRLLGEECDGGHGIEPWFDHGRFFTKEGKPAVLVGQPYNLDAQAVAELLASVERHDLRLLFSGGPSWHYPGAVLTVFVWRPDVLPRFSY